MRQRCAPVYPAQCERLVVAVQTAAIHPKVEQCHTTQTAKWPTEKADKPSARRFYAKI